MAVATPTDGQVDTETEMDPTTPVEIEKVVESPPDAKRYTMIGKIDVDEQGLRALAYKDGNSGRIPAAFDLRTGKPIGGDLLALYRDGRHALRKGGQPWTEDIDDVPSLAVLRMHERPGGKVPTQPALPEPPFGPPVRG